MKTLIIYHRDMDGICSALIARKRYPDAEMRSIEYSERDDFYFGKIADTRIILVDFSFNEKTMVMIKETAKEFIWIDHHESAAKMEIWKDTSITGLRSIKEAACILTWKTFIEHKPVPYSVRLVADRDMWTFKYGNETKAFHESCQQFNLDNKSDIDEIELILFSKTSDFVYDAIELGEQLLDYKEVLIKKIVKKGAMTLFKMPDKCIDKGFYANYKVFKCYSSIFTSDIGEFVLKKYPEAEFAVIEQKLWNEKKEKWITIVSLRSRKRLGDPDVSQVAEQFGGGGHVCAAGYEIM